MKKVIIILALCLALFPCFSTLAYAQEIEEMDELEIYIKDRIVPVAVGVLTAVIALLTTLGKVGKAVSSLRDTKETFSKEATLREEYSKSLKKEVESLNEKVKFVPELESKINVITEECQILAQILSLGFSSNSEIIKSGKGREMSVLLEKAKSKKETSKNEND